MTLLNDAAAAAGTWLRRDALPLWGQAGVDASGSFHERFTFDGQPDTGANRRLRVQARQLHVFSEAAVRGWWGPARAVADVGFEAFVRDWWAVDGRPGLIHVISPDRRPIDLTRDAYDHAFGLFALAWYYKASRAPRALALAHEMLDFVEAEMADRVHGGLLESLPPVLPRRSDPHMHLLEAMLEWSEADGHPRFLAMAARIVDLFKARFFDPRAGVLGEYFGEDLRPAGPSGETIAPGHQFEWCWLLAWAGSSGAGDAKAEADRLYAFGVGHGLDGRGFAIDECDRQGRQIRLSRRAWPQTELIKAYVTKAREGQAGAAEAAARSTLTFLAEYLGTEVPGLWMDQFDEEGRGVTATVPATTLYHAVVAFRELLLLAGEQG